MRPSFCDWRARSRLILGCRENPVFPLKPDHKHPTRHPKGLGGRTHSPNYPKLPRNRIHRKCHSAKGLRELVESAGSRHRRQVGIGFCAFRENAEGSRVIIGCLQKPSRFLKCVPGEDEGIGVITVQFSDPRSFSTSSSTVKHPRQRCILACCQTRSRTMKDRILVAPIDRIIPKVPIGCRIPNWLFETLHHRKKQKPPFPPSPITGTPKEAKNPTRSENVEEDKSACDRDECFSQLDQNPKNC
jgi:hypothetical protein